MPAIRIDYPGTARAIERKADASIAANLFPLTLPESPSILRHQPRARTLHCSNTARQGAVRLAFCRRRQAVMARTFGISPGQRR
jgi:hypothetical protein